MTAPQVVIVAGDLPFLDAATVQTLREALAADGTADGAILVDATGRDQPRVGCWSAAALRAALPADPAGGSMWRLISPLQVLRVPAALPLLDCDTPYELDMARAIAARQEGQAR